MIKISMVEKVKAKLRYIEVPEGEFLINICRNLNDGSVLITQLPKL